jgi:Phosphotransferase enzyme family
VAWFKACGPVQAFEPRLTAELATRWPGRVGELIAYDERRAWALLADAGVPLRSLGNPPELWLDILPLYAELQRGEATHAEDHLAHGVPPLPLFELPRRYADLIEHELPLKPGEIARLHAFAPRFGQLCAELETAGLPPTLQHDDLHMGSVYQLGGRLRVLDWGDCSVSHPFFSLVVTFRFLEEHSGLDGDDPWLVRLRDAYLEPWGEDLEEVFDLAVGVGRFAHAIAWARQREFLPHESALVPNRGTFDTWFAHILRRALAVI